MYPVWILIIVNILQNKKINIYIYWIQTIKSALLGVAFSYFEMWQGCQY